MNAISLKNLWAYIQSLSLTDSNKRWLANHLYESTGKKDPTCMTKKEFYAKLDRAERDIAEGKGIRFTNLDDMHAWLNAL